jgi:hypothetical protein
MIPSISVNTTDLAAVHVSGWIMGRQTLRQLRTTLHSADWKLPTCLWSDDGLDLDKVLPVSPIAGRLQCYRRFYGLLPVFQLRYDVVLQEKSARVRYCRKRQLAWRSHLPYHGPQVDP